MSIYLRKNGISTKVGGYLVQRVITKCFDAVKAEDEDTYIIDATITADYFKDINEPMVLYLNVDTNTTALPKFFYKNRYIDIYNGATGERPAVGELKGTYAFCFDGQSSNPKAYYQTVNIDIGEITSTYGEAAAYLTYEDGKTKFNFRLPKGSTVKIGDVIQNEISFNSNPQMQLDNIVTNVEMIHDDVDNINDDITDIKDLIPAESSRTNALVNQKQLNDRVTQMSSNFRGSYATWADVPISAEGYPADFSGNRAPTENDYMVVQNAAELFTTANAVNGYSLDDQGVRVVNSDFSYTDKIYMNPSHTLIIKCGANIPTGYHIRVIAYDKNDNFISQVIDLVSGPNSTKSGEVLAGTNYIRVSYHTADADKIRLVSDEHIGTWRFKYTGDWSVNNKNGWKHEYQINTEPLTEEQLAVLNSGISREELSRIENKFDDYYTASQTDNVVTAAEVRLNQAIGEAMYNAISKIIQLGGNSLYAVDNKRTIEVDNPLAYEEELVHGKKFLMDLYIANPIVNTDSVELRFNLNNRIVTLPLKNIRNSNTVTIKDLIPYSQTSSNGIFVRVEGIYYDLFPNDVMGIILPEYTTNAEVSNLRETIERIDTALDKIIFGENGLTQVGNMLIFGGDNE